MGDWKNMVVAATGAAGFLGSHLCEALVAEGATVLALDNFDVGSEANLEAVRQSIQLLRYDITRQSSNGTLAQADVVFHLAAIANPRVCQNDFARTYQVNIEGTRRVLEACRPEARVVFLSGAMAYGDPLELPIKETHPLGGRDSYALSKIAGECLTWALATSRRLRATVVRNFSTYGPRQSANYVIPSMITQAAEQGRIELYSTTPTRDFTYVSDTVKALLAVARCEALVGEAVNVGSGVETPVGEVARHVADLFGRVPVEDLHKEIVGSRRQCADNTKLRRATGWEPRMTIEESLKLTIHWLAHQAPRCAHA